MGGVVKDKGFYHPNGSPPRPVTTTHLCYPYNTDTHSYPMPPPPPPPKCTSPQTFFFTLLRCVFCQTTTTGSAAADEPSAAATTTLPSSGGGGGGGGYPPKEPANDSDPCICPMCQVRKGERGGGTTTFFNFGFPSTEIKRLKPNFFCSRSA